MPCMVMAWFKRNEGSGTSVRALGKCARGRHQLGMRNDFVHHADAQRLLRIKVIARETQSVRGLPSA